jgi:hypothetical protein
MSKLTGVDGPASEALFHVLNGGEYTSTQFGLLRNKKTGGMTTPAMARLASKRRENTPPTT